MDSRLKICLTIGVGLLAKKHCRLIGCMTSMMQEHVVGLQVLPYEEGQKYEPHYDCFLDEFNTKLGGAAPREGLSVKPKMGDALLFGTMRADATLDPSSLQECRTIRLSSRNDD